MMIAPCLESLYNMGIIWRDIAAQYSRAAVGLNSFGGYALFDGDGHSRQKASARISVELLCLH